MSNSQIISNILYPIEHSYDYTEVPAGYPIFSIAYLIYSTSHLDAARVNSTIFHNHYVH